MKSPLISIAASCKYVSFNDGASAELDLSDSLDGPIFEPLRDVEDFRSFSIRAWRNQRFEAPFLPFTCSTDAATVWPRNS
jgi:hypothetical protein